MENILQYSIIAIPVIIGVVNGINKKMNLTNKYLKEVTTIIVSILSIIYYIWFSGSLDLSLVIIMFIINYFGASGIYQFIPSKDKIFEIDVEDIPDFEEIDVTKGVN